ncbi:PPC domain-containing protein [Tolypothrix sp. FACHB-123]|uniref:PPC domain-containing protein n=1 Tax=Tolypothrix sp. FACHB-123 TaxID=2692868 RepID=UPI00168714DC|nr:PPC domain-containing protein [Tolypothrix sp. FACHB-123]
MFLSLRSKLILTVFVTSLLLAPPVKAQHLNVKDLLRNTPSTRLQFSPFTVGVVIRGATDRVYTLNLKKGNSLEINVDNTGARAGVYVFDTNGKQLAVLTANAKRNNFTYEVPSSGDYYIFCYGGPTNHFYGLTVTAE